MICAVIPTRYHPPELDRLLAVLWRDGVCTHLIVDAHDSEHRIHRMWNDGADAARAHGAEYIAVLNDDIEILPGTLPFLVRAFAVHESRRRYWEDKLGVVYPDRRTPWGCPLPANPFIEITKGDGFEVLTGFCFLFRAEIDVRFDESYRWWYGDNQFDKDVRNAGWQIGRVEGVPIHHRDNSSAERDWGYFAPLIAEDRRLWHERGGL